MILDIQNIIIMQDKFEFKHPYSCLDQRNTLITGLSTINMKKRKHFLYEIISQILEILPNSYKYFYNSTKTNYFLFLQNS